MVKEIAVSVTMLSGTSGLLVYSYRALLWIFAPPRRGYAKNDARQQMRTRSRCAAIVTRSRPPDPLLQGGRWLLSRQPIPAYRSRICLIHVAELSRARRIELSRMAV